MISAIKHFTDFSPNQLVSTPHRHISSADIFCISRKDFPHQSPWVIFSHLRITDGTDSKNKKLFQGRYHQKQLHRKSCDFLLYIRPHNTKNISVENNQQKQSNTEYNTPDKTGQKRYDFISCRQYLQDSLIAKNFLQCWHRWKICCPAMDTSFQTDIRPFPKKLPLRYPVTAPGSRPPWRCSLLKKRYSYPSIR